MFESCSYLECWVDMVITQIFKSGSNTDPENYRKITVLPALGKRFKIVLGNRLMLVLIMVHFKQDLKQTVEPQIIYALIYKTV